MIPQQDLRQVEGMNAFFIIPTNWRKKSGELFMTHPPLEKRLAALAEIAREMGRPVDVALGPRDVLFGRKQAQGRRRASGCSRSRPPASRSRPSSA